MAETIEEWLGLVAAAYEVGKSSWSTETLAIRRVEGGANNALFRVERYGTPLGTVKLCVDDERRRAAREYGALRLFQAARLDIAPEPLGLDESKTVVPLPTVVYRWVSGTPLEAHPTRQQLAALLETIQQMHSLHPGDYDLEISPAWFHWSAWTPYQVELAQLLSQYRPWLTAGDPEGAQLCDRMTRLADNCIEKLARAEVGPGGSGVAPSFCRVDPNLSNALWCRDGRLRWVDWEYSGWGDPALDLAELRWHNSLRGLSTAEQDRLRQSYHRPAGDGSFEERLTLWDSVLSTRWPLLLLRLLWSLKNGPDRVRLSSRAEDPAQVRTRMIEAIERAEFLAAATDQRFRNELAGRGRAGPVEQEKRGKVQAVGTGQEKNSIILACTWRPRGEMARLERLLPLLHEHYSAIVVALPPGTTPETLLALDGISWVVTAEWGHGRHAALAGALEQTGEHIHYADMDRLLHWVETRPEEWISTLSRIAHADCLVIGRSEWDWTTHPRAMRETERIFNTLFSFLLKQPLDLGAGSRGFSRAAATFLLANSPPGQAIGTDSEWVVLLQRGGFAIEQVTVDGLDWESADHYADSAADPETQRQAAEAYDDDPLHWARRVQLVQEIVDAGLAALDRKLKKG